MSRPADDHSGHDTGMPNNGGNTLEQPKGEAQAPGGGCNVSVVIPAYNAAGTLRRAVQSVWAQTCRPMEVVIVDDGSCDDTAAVAWALESEHPGWIHVVQHADGGNHGVSAARNLGIAHAVGEYIAFLDADDEWLPDKMREQMEIFRRHPAVGFVHTFIEWRDERDSGGNREPRVWPRKPVPSPYDRRATLELMLEGRLFMYPSSVVVRASLLGDTPFIEGLPFQNEDGLFHAMMAIRTELCTVAKPHCRYYVTHGSQLGRTTRDRIHDLVVLDFQVRLCRWLKTQPDFRSLATHFARTGIPEQIRVCYRKPKMRLRTRHFLRIVASYAQAFPVQFLRGLWRGGTRRLWK